MKLAAIILCGDLILSIGSILLLISLMHGLHSPIPDDEERDTSKVLIWVIITALPTVMCCIGWGYLFYLLHQN